MTVKRVVISAGGTGGHLYPAQALAQQLLKSRTKNNERDVLFVAGGLAKSRYFDRDSFAFKEVASHPLLSRNLIKSFKGLRSLFKGIGESAAILKEYKPDVVVGFGSYYSVATLVAARWLKIPIILHEANSVPGKANQWLAPLANTIGLHFPSTARYFKNNTFEVGLPLREGYRLSDITKQEALAYYRFSDDQRTLLICGGSQGARSINLFIRDSLTMIKDLSLQIIHLTGNPEMVSELSSLYESHKITAQVKPFENHMQMAWRAADFFVGRSGASTIAESIEFEVPGILIPYPHATDGHQEKNADFLVEIVGGAFKLLETDFTTKKLSDLIGLLMHSDVHRCSLKDYKQHSNRMTLCQLVLNKGSI